jgi:hypothetical protein
LYHVEVLPQTYHYDLGNLGPSIQKYRIDEMQSAI